MMTAAALLGIGVACASSSSTTSSAPTPAGAPTAAASANKTNTWDGLYTTAQAERGAQLFQATCNKCHGVQPDGTPGDGGKLVGKEFVGSYDGGTLDGLFTTIYTSMPSDNPKSLPTKDVADILAYLLQANQFPAGAGVLTDDLEQLKKLKIAASKP